LIEIDPLLLNHPVIQKMAGLGPPYNSPLCLIDK
jgi:hypothetical protein